MKNLLLPYPWKQAGYLLTFAGMMLAILYFLFDFRFSIPVFAVVSSFLETRMFVTFRTNFADELILLLLICGLGLIVCSKEKSESEIMDALRSGAFIRAIIANTSLLLFSVLFVYGSGFLAVLTLNIFSFPVFYLLFFHLRRQREKD